MLMCYSECHSVDFISLREAAYNHIGLCGHDTLRPLGIWIRPITNSVHDTKYHSGVGNCGSSN